MIRRSEAENPWFSRANVVSAIQAICTDMLDGRNLGSWLARYPAAGRPSDETVGIVMAGNIPLVGFFDLLCVLICDRRCLIKPSSKDRILIGHIVDLLREIEPRFSIGALEGKVPDRLIGFRKRRGPQAFRLGLPRHAFPAPGAPLQRSRAFRAGKRQATGRAV